MSTNQPDKNPIITKLRLNPNQMGYIGQIKLLTMHDAEFYLPDDLKEYYSPYWIVSHEGLMDIILYFGRFRITFGEFIVDLVCLFNSNTILKFLKVIKPFSDPIDFEKIASKNSIDNNQKSENKKNNILSKGMAFS